MWFSKRAKSTLMTKVTLNDGQEFVDKADSFGGGPSGVRIIIDNEYVFFPMHRVLDIRSWKESQ